MPLTVHLLAQCYNKSEGHFGQPKNISECSYFNTFVGPEACPRDISGLRIINSNKSWLGFLFVIYGMWLSFTGFRKAHTIYSIVMSFYLFALLINIIIMTTDLSLNSLQMVCSIVFSLVVAFHLDPKDPHGVINGLALGSLVGLVLCIPIFSFFFTVQTSITVGLLTAVTISIIKPFRKPMLTLVVCSLVSMELLNLGLDLWFIRPSQNKNQSGRTGIVSSRFWQLISPGVFWHLLSGVWASLGMVF